MLPIRTESSNFIYRSLIPDTPDMPGERIEPGHIRSVWDLMDWERDNIFQGGNIALHIYAEPIPPVSLGVTNQGVNRTRSVISAERFQSSDDGCWYVRISRDGITLIESEAYRREGSAWLAQRGLKRILPALEIWPS